MVGRSGAAAVTQHYLAECFCPPAGSAKLEPGDLLEIAFASLLRFPWTLFNALPPLPTAPHPVPPPFSTDLLYPPPGPFYSGYPFCLYCGARVDGSDATLEKDQTCRHRACHRLHRFRWTPLAPPDDIDVYLTRDYGTTSRVSPTRAWIKVS